MLQTRRPALSGNALKGIAILARTGKNFVRAFLRPVVAFRRGSW